jgi:hypothetical protein
VDRRAQRLPSELLFHQKFSAGFPYENLPFRYIIHKLRWDIFDINNGAICGQRAHWRETQIGPQSIHSPHMSFKAGLPER